MNPPTGIYNNLLPMKNTASLINLRTVNMDVSIITITIYVQIVTTGSDRMHKKSLATWIAYSAPPGDGVAAGKRQRGRGEVRGSRDHPLYH